MGNSERGGGGRSDVDSEVAGVGKAQRRERERERERESFVMSESTTSSPARGGRFWGGFR